MQTRRTLLQQIGVAAVLPAVGTAVSPGPAIAQGAKIVRLADQNGSEVDYAAVWVAELNGYYEQEGIKIDRKTYPNGPSALLDINNLDAVLAAIVPFMQFVARGGDVRIVMSVTKGNAPIVGKKQCKSVKDLDRKKVGTPGIGTIHDAVLGYIQRMPPIPNSESLQLAFTPAFVKANPDTVEKFVRATLKGVEWIKANSKEKTAELVARKMNDPKSYAVNLDALGSVDLTQPRLDMASTRIWLTTIAKQGKIPEDLVKDVDAWVGKYLDYSFLDKAEAALKKM